MSAIPNILVCKVSFHLFTGVGTPTPIIEHHDAWSFSKCMTMSIYIAFSKCMTDYKSKSTWLSHKKGTRNMINNYKAWLQNITSFYLKLGYPFPAEQKNSVEKRYKSYFKIWYTKWNTYKSTANFLRVPNSQAMYAIINQIHMKKKLQNVQGRRLFSHKIKIISVIIIQFHVVYFQVSLHFHQPWDQTYL
jgi:hypothetical protein